LDGPQRIRGLAGSGKTIVLSLKAAYLHLNHPNSRIVYTFSTRSLYDYIQQLITRFYMKISDGRVPDFESGIKIMHAWGGKNVPGLYYYACMENNINTIDYSTASRNKGEKEDAFSYVCSDFIKKTEYNAEKIFDFILMDEAQDFNANFYQLCRSIVKDDHLIWGYDELQNIFNVKIQNTKDTFQNEFDKTGLDLEALNDCNIDNDIVLPKSYRNIKKILMAAVSVGFGVYNNILIQSLENNNHWIDLGFEVYEGDCSKQEDVKIRRLDKNSPLKLPDTYKDDDILRHYSATNLEDEIDFVYQKILFALKQGKLREDDIAVICLDDRNNKAYLNELEMRLSESGIACNNIMDRNYVKGFSLERKITLTSVYKAKGNEAAMVFVVGCDVFEDQKDSRTMRNKIFTAFTRAKIWLCISGVNIADRCLIKELDTLKNNNYELHFKNTPHSILERDWHKQTKRVADQNEFAIQIRNLLNRKTLDTKDLHSIIDEISGGKKNNE